MIYLTWEKCFNIKEFYWWKKENNICNIRINHLKEKVVEILQTMLLILSHCIYLQIQVASFSIKFSLYFLKKFSTVFHWNNFLEPPKACFHLNLDISIHKIPNLVNQKLDKLDFIVDQHLHCQTCPFILVKEKVGFI